jgi:hypothetical protein
MIPSRTDAIALAQAIVDRDGGTRHVYQAQGSWWISALPPPPSLSARLVYAMQRPRNGQKPPMLSLDVLARAALIYGLTPHQISLTTARGTGGPIRDARAVVAGYCTDCLKLKMPEVGHILNVNRTAIHNMISRTWAAWPEERCNALREAVEGIVDDRTLTASSL